MWRECSMPTKRILKQNNEQWNKSLQTLAKRWNKAGDTTTTDSHTTTQRREMYISAWYDILTWDLINTDCRTSMWTKMWFFDQIPLMSFWLIHAQFWASEPSASDLLSSNCACYFGPRPYFTPRDSFHWRLMADFMTWIKTSLWTQVSSQENYFLH